MTAIASLPGFAVMPAGNMVSEGGNQGGATADFAALLAARFGDPQGTGNAIAAAQTVPTAGATRFVDGPLFGHWIGAASSGAWPNQKAGPALALPSEPEEVATQGLSAQSPAQLHEAQVSAVNAVRVIANGQAPALSSVIPSSRSSIMGPAQVLGSTGEDGAQVSTSKAQLHTIALAVRVARVASLAPLHVAMLPEASGYRLVLRAAGMPDDELHETVARLLEEAESAGVSVSAVTVNGKPLSLYGSF